MLNIYKTIDNKLVECDKIEKDCWINLADPTEEELQFVKKTLLIDDDFLRAALDKEEISRVETDDDTGYALITLDVPIFIQDKAITTYSTIPVGIIETQDNIVTVCLQKNQIIEDFVNGKIKNVFTNLRTRFIFQLLYHIATRFLLYLRRIDKCRIVIEKKLQQTMQNQGLIQLQDLDKSLVFFSTSLRANMMVLEKIQRGRILKLYDDDAELLEDVLIEVEQAIEMSNIYSNILSGTMGAFSSIISNNMNTIMKILTSITILLAIPTMISGFYGMNVSNLPMPTFGFSMLVSVLITAFVAFILYKKNMLS